MSHCLARFRYSRRPTQIAAAAIFVVYDVAHVNGVYAYIHAHASYNQQQSGKRQTTRYSRDDQLLTINCHTHSLKARTQTRYFFLNFFQYFVPLNVCVCRRRRRRFGVTIWLLPFIFDRIRDDHRRYGPVLTLLNLSAPSAFVNRTCDNVLIRF